VLPFVHEDGMLRDKEYKPRPEKAPLDKIMYPSKPAPKMVETAIAANSYMLEEE
jgi:hypothetical protein